MEEGFGKSKSHKGMKGVLIPQFFDLSIYIEQRGLTCPAFEGVMVLQACYDQRLGQLEFELSTRKQHVSIHNT